MMKEVNLGLIGLGSMGKIHLKNCLRLRNARLVSVADSSKKELKFAEKMRVKSLYTDYTELLNDKNVDAVILSLPNFLHKECSQRAADAGKDIFLEKPLARNVVEGQEIVEHVKRRGMKLMVGYPSRFATEFVELKRKLERGVLGDVQMASATNIGEGPFSPRGEVGRPAPVPSWWFNKELMGGGALLDLGIHAISLFRWYFGEVSESKSYLGHRFRMEFEDHALCFMKFKDGPFATINVGWFSKSPHVSVRLHGTVSHASVVRSPPSVLDTVLNDIRRKLGKVDRSVERYYRELEYFVECVKSDVSPSPSGEEALQDLRVVFKAYENSFRLSP